MKYADAWEELRDLLGKEEYIWSAALSSVGRMDFDTYTQMREHLRTIKHVRYIMSELEEEFE